MNYLILYNNKAFYSSWFDYENNYAEGMIVFNISKHLYTIDGKNWIDIDFDHL